MNLLKYVSVFSKEQGILLHKHSVRIKIRKLILI